MRLFLYRVFSGIKLGWIVELPSILGLKNQNRTIEISPVHFIENSTEVNFTIECHGDCLCSVLGLSISYKLL